MVLAAAVAVAPSLAQGAPPKVDAKLRGTRAPATELKQSKVIAVPGGGTLYRFRQQVSGVPVLGGEAVVSDPAAAPPGLVVDVTKARIQKPPAPRIPEDRAIATADRDVPTREPDQAGAQPGRIFEEQVLTFAEDARIARLLELRLLGR